MRTSSGAGGDARAAFDRRRGDAAGELGADFGLFVGEQRSGDAEVAFDRTALDRGGRHGDGFGARHAGVAADAGVSELQAVDRAPAAQEQRPER